MLCEATPPPAMSEVPLCGGLCDVLLASDIPKNSLPQLLLRLGEGGAVFSFPFRVTYCWVSYSMYSVVLQCIPWTKCYKEILVDMNERIITRYKLLSMAPDKLMLSAVFSMMARTLTTVDDHRYYFDAMFGKISS